MDEVDIAGMFSMVVVDELLAGTGAADVVAGGCCTTADCEEDALDDAFEVSEEADDTCVGRFGKGATAGASCCWLLCLCVILAGV